MYQKWGYLFRDPKLDATQNLNKFLRKHFQIIQLEKFHAISCFHFYSLACPSVLPGPICLQGNEWIFQIYLVHLSDPCRMDILIPGEQRYYLRAQNPQDRQKWVVALGSCKAGLISPDVSSVERLRKSPCFAEPSVSNDWRLLLFGGNNDKSNVIDSIEFKQD